MIICGSYISESSVSIDMEKIKTKMIEEESQRIL
jgi:hypothetical protein